MIKINYTTLFFLSFFCSFFVNAQVQTISDTFEGTGNINSWTGDDCELNTKFTNPYQNGINTSKTVLKYSDVGGQFANVRFDAGSNFNLTSNSTFSLKIYVSSNGITGNQTNKVSLKLQNGSIPEPWTTQSEIIKPIVLNKWQVVTFNFATDNYLNLDSNSINPIYRSDFNRVLIQINGENNNDLVLAYIDDFLYTFSDNAPKFNNLVWSDEFDGNGTVNSTNWFHQTQLPSIGSWYNGELQHYTNRQINSFVSNGALSIIAKKESYTNQGKTKQYTSARLNSKFAFQYGRVEVRAKLPTGAGTWPAIWMLGQNINEVGAFWSSNYGTVNWPACGEIDIMEHWGSNQNFVQSAMHTPSSSGSTINLGGRTISTVSSQFHIYALEWTSEKMIFSVDNIVHYVYNPKIKDNDTWPFNAPQYLLLNIAIEPSVAKNFTQSTMEIDYVRVYQEGALSTSTPIKSKDIALYPNPFSDKLTIQINDIYFGSRATIYSFLGQELNSYILSEQQNTFDLSGYQKGVYLITIEGKTGASTYKIIKN